MRVIIVFLYRHYQVGSLNPVVFVGTISGMPRPRKKPGEARDAILQVRLTAAERKLLDDAARTRTLDTSAWVRMEVIAIAKRILKAEGSPE